MARVQDMDFVMIWEGAIVILISMGLTATLVCKIIMELIVQCV